MPINFAQFENQLINYFESQIARNEDDTASFITKMYTTYMLTGQDALYGNMVTKYNDKLLEQALKSAFNIARSGNSNTHFAQMVSQGLIGFWTGATLLNGIPPPGSILVVNNIVSSPGSPQPLIVINTRDTKQFAKNLINMFRGHLLTISGITTALVPQPSGPPIPISFPFVGYK